MFTVDQVIADYYPALSRKKVCTLLIKPILRQLLHEQAFRDFAERYPHLKGVEFVEQVLEHFNFSCSVPDRERENIPTRGKVVIIANHPLGSLDGLALFMLVREIRSDVKIVANDLLMTIGPLQPIFLPVRVTGGANGRKIILSIRSQLQQGGAVIMFPAGEVSRLGPHGIRDGLWHSGFLKLAESTGAGIVPVHIHGRNSLPFYCVSLLAKSLSTLMLVGEMFNRRAHKIRLTVGPLIPCESHRAVGIARTEKIRLFKKHLYRLGTGKKPLFKTEKPIARPERKTELKKSVRLGERLGTTPDGKVIYLCAQMESSPLMREIGRLREETFRAVGEGTGYRRDLDKFDNSYQHLVLWDEEEPEIVGAYRFIDAGNTVREQGIEGLYSGTLFILDEQRCSFLHQGLELGRSFVQQCYWGKRSLDYLWYGIGSFLARNPGFRYLFGPVSISNAMPRMARELLIYFYKLHFSGDLHISCSRHPFTFSQPVSDLERTFSGKDYRKEFRKLKLLLAELGTAVPPLYKQYTELCEQVV